MPVALEKCAPVFRVLLKSRIFRRSFLKLLNLLAELGIFLLQCRELGFVQNKLLLDKDDAFLEHCRRSALNDEALDLTKQGGEHG